jgi:hypothetical protein
MNCNNTHQNIATTHRQLDQNPDAVSLKPNLHARWRAAAVEQLISCSW